MLYLADAFSFNMLGEFNKADIRVVEVPESEAAEALRATKHISAVGHQATATILSQRLGVDIPANRISLTLKEADIVLVAQATMPRLAEGQVLSKAEMDTVPIRYFYVFIRWVESTTPT